MRNLGLKWKLDEKLNQVSTKHQKKSRCFIQTPRFIIGESQKVNSLNDL